MGDIYVISGAAMALAARSTDDLRILLGVLGLTTREQAIAVCTRVFPDEALPDRARLLLKDLIRGDGPQGGEENA